MYLFFYTCRFQNKRAKLKKDPCSPDVLQHRPLSQQRTSSHFQISPDVHCPLPRSHSFPMNLPLSEFKRLDKNSLQKQSSNLMTPLPTPPSTSGHIMSPRHLPALDLNLHNWATSSPHYLASSNDMMKTPLLENNKDTSSQKGSSSLVYDSKGNLAAHRISPLPIPFRTWSAPGTPNLSLFNSNGWNNAGFPVAPLSFVGPRSEIMRDKPDFLSKKFLNSFYEQK